VTERSSLAPDKTRVEPLDTAVRLPGKARFDHIYNEPDPRAYFRGLRPLEYQTPAHGQPIFAALVARLQEVRKRKELAVLDLCCSYGVNAALLNHDLTLASLYERYCSQEVDALSTAEMVAADSEFYERRRRPSPHRVAGLDIASSAVSYALRVGLLEAGSSENLEKADPSGDFAAEIADVDLITVTGGFSYIGERTLGRVLSAIEGPPPWLAAFYVRWMDWTPVAAVAADHGLATETLASRTFVQRRFADEEEARRAMVGVRRAGLDPTGKEADGYLHVEFLLARPFGDRKEGSLEELLGLT
jgi:hypothetical protein